MKNFIVKPNEIIQNFEYTGKQNLYKSFDKNK